MGRVDVAISARARGMQRLCVLKRVRADLRSDEQDARFRREAEIAMTLTHGAIAQTLDVEEIDGELAILQEYIHGTTLAYLERRAAPQDTLPVTLTIHIVAEVARALGHAHSLRIVHRDVTPDNIMISYAGEVKLIDFGIAKPVGDESLTQARLVVGRPLFTAPEILAGHETDPRADIYSLGVVLWMSLTGRQFPDPYELGPAPAPSTFNAAVSGALDEICLRAIATQPEERIQSAEDFWDALAALPGAARMQDRQVATYLAKHFDVEEERRQLSRDIDEARAILARTTAAPLPVAAPPEKVSGPVEPPALVESPQRSRAVPLALGVGLLMGAVAATAVVLLARPVKSTATARAVQPSHAAPVVPAATVPQDIPPQVRSIEEPVLVPAAEPSETSAAPDALRPGRRARQSARRSSPPPELARPEPQELLRDAATSLKAGDFNRAYSLAQTAAQAGAGPSAYLIMGKVFFAKGDLSRAQAEFRRVTAMRPGDREATSFLEVIAKENGRAP